MKRFLRKVLVIFFKFTFFNAKIQQVLYMCPNLSSIVFILNLLRGEFIKKTVIVRKEGD